MGWWRTHAAKRRLRRIGPDVGTATGGSVLVCVGLGAVYRGVFGFRLAARR